MSGVNSTEKARRGRPTTARVRADCNEIARLIAAGENEFEIREKLGLSRSAYRHRMRQLKRNVAVDTRFLWTRLWAGASADLKRLDELGDMLLRASPPRGRDYVVLAAARARLRREIIDQGAALGVYSRGVTQGRDTRGNNGELSFRQLFPSGDGDGARHEDAQGRARRARP